MFKPWIAAAALALVGLGQISGPALGQDLGSVVVSPAAQAGIAEEPPGETEALGDVQLLMPAPAPPVTELNVMREIRSRTAEAAPAAPDNKTIRQHMPAPATPPSTLNIEREASRPADTDQPAATASIGRSPDTPAADGAPAPGMVAPDTAAPEQQQSPARAAIGADALGQAIERQRGQSHLPAKEMQALADLYAARDMTPLWFGDNGWRASARAALARLALAGEDGLRPERYAVPMPASTADEATLAAADVALSEAVVLYARDARGARINPLRISPLITAKPEIPGVAEILATVAEAPDADAALHGFNPPHAGYVALRDKLAEMRQAKSAQPAAIRIPPGQLLRVGMQDARVPLLRKRLALPDGGDLTYDDALAEAVTAFQKANHLAATGVLNRATTLALSGERGATVSEAEIIANMERWRWLPRDLGQRYIMVNIPEFTLRLMQDGAAIHTARVIVGKTDAQTPVFSGNMEYLVVNPSWNVPQSILQKEFLPQMAIDPDYAAKKGFLVERHGNRISIRQPPGERNALGHIKFMFPNRHAVYIHDTPSRELFADAMRAYSHGCVRVQEPFQLAELVLGGQNGWNEVRLRGMIGRGERQINLKQVLPVHLVYFTTWVDETGKLQSRNDLYGHSRRVQAALGLS